MKFNIDDKYILDHRKEICTQLRERREALGISQDELAEKSGMTRSTISKIENGDWNFGFGFLTVFLKHLDLEIEIKEKK